MYHFRISSSPRHCSIGRRANSEYNQHDRRANSKNNRHDRRADSGPVS